MGGASTAFPGTRPTLPLLADLALAAGLGAVHTVAFVHTQLWLLAIASVGWLAWRAGATGPGRAAALGWLYGTGWLCAGTWWLFISMYRYGGLPAWMAAAAVLALSAFLSLYLGGAMAAFARWRSGRWVRDALLFGSVWLLAELARGIVLTGFPWVASGYAQLDAPLAGLAPWVGVYGIGWVQASIACALAASLTRGPRRWAGPAAAIAAMLLSAGLSAQGWTRPNGVLSVTLLQGNVPQEEKFSAEHQDAALQWHADALLKSDTDLVVAPETAIPFLPQQLPEGFWTAFSERFASGSTHALFGVPLGDEQAGYTNSAMGFAPGRSPYRYDKHHLVPFGEFIPTGFRWFTELMNIPLGDFNRGSLEQPSFAVKGERVAPNICYEDLFGEELAARFRDEARAPTVFANISNIGWFGQTIAVDQHRNISRMRSLEFERPMLRATNTGATVVIDHRGHVNAGLAPYTRGVLRATVQGRTGTTPYAWWASRFSLWPLALLAGLVVAAAVLRAGPRPT
jgi:apolipoprotein N-acyltransferase